MRGHFSVTIAEASNPLIVILRCVEHTGQRVLVTEENEILGAVIPVEDLERLGRDTLEKEAEL